MTNKSLQNSTRFIKKRLHSGLIALIGVFLVLSPLIPLNTAKAITLSPPRLELNGDPGSVISAEIKITNQDSESRIYFTQVENFEAGDEEGNPNFTQTKEGLATWVEVVSSFNVKAGESEVVPFTINIPKNAEPGGYFASLFVRTTPPPTKGGEVSIGARLGSLILLRVNGDIAEGVDILEYSSQGKNRFFTTLPVSLYYRFQNTGADRVKPVGTIAIKNLIGMNAKVLSANRTEGSVLPRSIRRFEADWITSGGGQEDIAARPVAVQESGFFSSAKQQWQNFAFGIYTAKLDITFGENNTQAKDTFRFIVFPWQLLSMLLVIVIVALVVLRFILRRYNRHIIKKHAK